MKLPTRSHRGFGRAVDTVVIGAGHSGLAMSSCLAARSIEHVVLERGEVANAWRHERWNSLRLLTPNWQSRLPGYAYRGEDPDGFMTMPEVVDFVAGYARSVSAPVRTGTGVLRVQPTDEGFRVVTDQGNWRCRAAVLANGAFGIANVPAVDADVPRTVARLTARDYRNPDQLGVGGVLVVGSSATGLQLADEIQRSGRAVTLAVGEHVRMPRVYRGRDIQWWMDAAGVLDQRWTEVDDIARARRVPSPQLVGSADRRTLDLNSLQDCGVRIVGRFVGMSDGVARFSGSLRNHCKMADLKLARLLATFDDWARQSGHDGELAPAERPAPTRVDGSPSLTLDMAAAGIGTIVWATGFRPDYSWLAAPAFDRKGRLEHEGGVVKVPGLYAMGLPFLRRRKSSYIHGAGDDARELSDHLVDHLRGVPRELRLRATG